MAEILHAWALVPTAVGACCAAADRRRVRMPELAASVLMLLAMADAMLTGIVATVYWCGMLMLTAIAIAALRRGRGPRGSEQAMSLHTTVGLVTMAGLMLVGGHASSAATAHQHGPSTAGLVLAVIIAGLGYAAWSVVNTIRAHSHLGRAQYVAMGAAMTLMAVGAL